MTGNVLPHFSSRERFASCAHPRHTSVCDSHSFPLSSRKESPVRNTTNIQSYDSIQGFNAAPMRWHHGDVCGSVAAIRLSCLPQYEIWPDQRTPALPSIAPTRTVDGQSHRSPVSARMAGSDSPAHPRTGVVSRTRPPHHLEHRHHLRIHERTRGFESPAALNLPPRYRSLEVGDVAGASHLIRGRRPLGAARATQSLPG
jgi:hypothetical protein